MKIFISFTMSITITFKCLESTMNSAFSSLTYDIAKDTTIKELLNIVFESEGSNKEQLLMFNYIYNNKSLGRDISFNYRLQESITINCTLGIFNGTQIKKIW
jgi:hypothetical protein